MSSIFELFKPLDTAVFNFFSRIHSVFFDLITPWFTDVMVSVVFVLIFVWMFLYAKKKKQFEVFWAFIVSTLGSFLFSSVLKHFIARARPLNGLVDEGSSYSFPSNHSVLAFSMYGFIVFLICRSTLHKKHKILVSGILSLVILLVGASRLYLGVHYTSDVLGGYIVGLVFLLISTRMVQKIEDDTV